MTPARTAALLLGAILTALLAAVLWHGTAHPTTTCYTPCDCTHPTDRPCR